MGNSGPNFFKGRERLNGTGLHVLHHSKHNDLEPPKSLGKKVETAKLLMGIFSALGIPAYVLGIVWNFGDIKGWLLFIVGFLYAVVRLYFYVVRQKQDQKLKDLQIKREIRDMENEIYPHQ